MSTNGKTHHESNGSVPAALGNGLVRAMVIDPQPCFSEGLRALLNFFHQGTEVVATSTSLNDLRSIGDLNFDVLIVDSELIADDSWELVAKATHLVPPIRIVVLASAIDPLHVAKAFTHGVIGYLDKDISSEDLVHAIRLAKAGQVVISPVVVEAILKGHKDGDRQLTELERLVLTYVAKGLDNEEIAKQVALSASTLKRTLQKVVTKLKAENRIQAAVIATRNGLI